jgi:hypothetical protein
VAGRHGQLRGDRLTAMFDIDEILSLDLLTLREHTVLAGDVLDAATQRRLLEQSIGTAEVVTVRRGGTLVAYAMLRPQEAGLWFVLGFNTHPAHRDASVFRELFAQIAALAARRSITALRSNVYRSNRLSMAFHRRLGFSVTRENAKGVEFTANLRELMGATRALRPRGAVRA